MLAISASDSFALSRPLEEAQITANNALVNSDKVVLKEVNTINGDTVCYTFAGNNGGYAIVSADSRVPKLLAYSEMGEITPEIREMVSFFSKNIDANQHQNMVLSNSNGSGLRATRIENSPIEPLLKKIEWGQTAPFNMKTPVFGEENGPVGCVATAVSQILYYYRYPSATLADIPEYTTATEGISVEGVAKGTVFDWDNIIDYYGEGYTDAQANAVSDLMSVVDVAAKMDFKANEGSSSATFVKELVDYFGYDPDLIKMAYRSSFSFADWSQLIYEELKNSRIVLMSGSTVKSGHRFLCDGIDENGLFHINWGWDGRYNGYFDLALLNPNTTTEAGSSSTTDGYSKNNYIVYGIQPDNGIVDTKEETAIVDAVSVKYQITNGKVYLFFEYANLTQEEQTIQIADGYIDEKGKVVKIASIGKYTMNPTTPYSQSNGYSLDFSTFEEGKTYKVGLIESVDGKNWIPCKGFDHVNYTFTVKNNTVMLADNYELSATLEMTDFNYLNQYAHGVIHLSNSGSREYYNTIYLMTNSIDVNPNKYSFVSYATAEAGDSNDVDFKFIPTSDTVYYWIMDANMNLINNGVIYKENKTFKLNVKASIDTTELGTRVCRLYIKNEGEAYYDNQIRTVLYSTKGNTVLSSALYLEPGQETIISTEIKTDFEYSRYAIYDYNAEQIVYDDLDGSSLPNSDAVTMDFDFDHFYVSDHIVNATLVFNNGSSEKFEATYYVELDTTGTYSGDVVLSFSVSIDPGARQKVPLEIVVEKDSCTLLIYKDDDTRKRFFKVMASKDLDDVMEVFANKETHLNVWSIGTTLYVESDDEDELLQITTVDGRIIASRRLHKGETFMQELPAGIYVVNGEKILVR